MTPAQAALLRLEKEQALAEGCRYGCDCCHAALGVQWADGFWACQQCAERVAEKLLGEQASTSPMFRRKRCR